MTFSLVARCPDTGLCGVAIAFSSPAVAARCVHTRAGVGTVASQNVTDPSPCPALLDLMADVPRAIVDAFAANAGHLGDRLIAALRAGLAAGGEAGPVHSAGLQFCDRLSWPVADLRCDWTEVCPIEAVATAWDVYRPQMDAYVTRALDPTQATSYGVPGDV